MLGPVFGIEDEEIADAVKYHTTGRADMTMLEKIIFVADAAEQTRTYDKMVAEWRKKAKTNLDEAIVMILNYNILKVVKKGFVLHENTVKARNYILVNKNGRDD